MLATKWFRAFVPVSSQLRYTTGTHFNKPAQTHIYAYLVGYPIEEGQTVRLHGAPRARCRAGRAFVTIVKWKCKAASGPWSIDIHGAGNRCTRHTERKQAMKQDEPPRMSRETRHRTHKSQWDFIYLRGATSSPGLAEDVIPCCWLAGFMVFLRLEHGLHP